MREHTVGQFLNWACQLGNWKFRGVCQLKLVVKVCMIDIFLERRLNDFSRFTKESVTLEKLRAIDLDTYCSSISLDWVKFLAAVLHHWLLLIGSYLKLLGQELGTDSRRANKWLHRPMYIHRHLLT